MLVGCACVAAAAREATSRPTTPRFYKRGLLPGGRLVDCDVAQPVEALAQRGYGRLEEKTFGRPIGLDEFADDRAEGFDVLAKMPNLSNCCVRHALTPGSPASG